MAQEITLNNFKALFPDVNQVKAALTRVNVEAILDDPTRFTTDAVKKAIVLGQLQSEGWFTAQGAAPAGESRLFFILHILDDSY